MIVQNMVCIMVNKCEIIDLIQAIEDKKKELKDAQEKCMFLPEIINNLEIQLFIKLREDKEYEL